MFLVEAMASVLVETWQTPKLCLSVSTHYCGFESAISIEDLLRGFWFREVVSLSPVRYRKWISSGMESSTCDEVSLSSGRYSCS